MSALLQCSSKFTKCLEQLQNTGPYFQVLNRSCSVARQSRQVFKERERYKTYKYKTDIEGKYFSMYYSRLQVYILVARWLGDSSVEVIQFSGSTARWLVSRDYRATEPPQRICLENLPCILQLSHTFSFQRYWCFHLPGVNILLWLRGCPCSQKTRVFAEKLIKM